MSTTYPAQYKRPPHIPANITKGGNLMSCKCATFQPDEGRWSCSVSGDGCMYLIPNSKKCAEQYGEGPDVVYDDESK